MRLDPPEFAAANQAAAKRPRLVLRHIFDVASIYVTSSADMVNVPGIALRGHLEGVSAVSQEIFPDEARSTIGSLNYSIVDIDGEFSAALRNQLQVELQDLRLIDVELRFGYTDDYNDTIVLFTQQVRAASFDDGVYRIGCEDIQRETRKDILEPKVTTLRLSVSEADTTIPVQDTTGFQTVFHGPSYSDAPDSTVGYFRLDDEIIRYTGITADSFTGCTRGVFNTVPVPHEVEAGAEDDRQPEITEFIYLELPGPKLDYAILTGVLAGDAASLPAHWHAGVPTSKVSLSQFQNIGPDLWDTTDDDATLVLRFAGLEKTDAMQFLEEQVRQPLGVYAPVLSDGSLGLRRMNHVLADAPYVMILNEDSFSQVGALQHDYLSLLNVFSIDWNWDPIAERFTRRRSIVDQASIDVHGEADTKSLEWQGLHGSRHTDAILRKRADSIRDRYAAPPLRMSGQLLHSYNVLEIGDVVRVQLEHVRDYTGPAGPIDRSFEIQRIAVDQVSGDVSVNLFGSSAQASILPPDTGTALPDAWYQSEGTELSTVATIVGGVIQPGIYTLTGNANLNNAGAIYYYLGDLELADGATLLLDDNVQLRVRGFFTRNGDIGGVGRGIPGATDDGILGNDNAGTPGFVGNTKGWGGLNYLGSGDIFVPRESISTFGLHSAFPLLELSVQNGALTGLPADLRGTSGGIGGRILDQDASILAQGGAGGAGGAGLTVICRGSSAGVSGSIDLSGGDSSLGQQVQVNGRDYRAGSGAPGGPGSVLFVIDGSAPSLPDVLSTLTGSHGSMPNAGTPPSGTFFFDQWLRWPETNLRAGYNNALVQNMTASVLRIQRLAGEQTPSEDLVVAPTNLTATALSDGVLLSWTVAWGIRTQIYASSTNNRADAVQIALADNPPYVDNRVLARDIRYYWSRAIDDNGRRSAWHPSDPNMGVAGNPSEYGLVNLNVTDPSISLGSVLTDYYTEILTQPEAPVTTPASVTYQTGLGRDGTDAIDLVGGIGSGPASGDAGFETNDRFRIGSDVAHVQTTWRVTDTTGLVTNMVVAVVLQAYDAPSGGVAVRTLGWPMDWPPESDEWQTYSVLIDLGSNAENYYWSVSVQVLSRLVVGDQVFFSLPNDHVVRVDSILVYAWAGEVDSFNRPALVPPVTGTVGHVLRDDGGWGPPNPDHIINWGGVVTPTGDDTNAANEAIKNQGGIELGRGTHRIANTVVLDGEKKMLARPGARLERVAGDPSTEPILQVVGAENFCDIGRAELRFQHNDSPHGAFLIGAHPDLTVDDGSYATRNNVIVAPTCFGQTDNRPDAGNKGIYFHSLRRKKLGPATSPTYDNTLIHPYVEEFDELIVFSSDANANQVIAPKLFEYRTAAIRMHGCTGNNITQGRIEAPLPVGPDRRYAIHADVHEAGTDPTYQILGAHDNYIWTFAEFPSSLGADYTMSLWNHVVPASGGVAGVNFGANKIDGSWQLGFGFGLDGLSGRAAVGPNIIVAPFKYANYVSDWHHYDRQLSEFNDIWLHRNVRPGFSEFTNNSGIEDFIDIEGLQIREAILVRLSAGIHASNTDRVTTVDAVYQLVRTTSGISIAVISENIQSPGTSCLDAALPIPKTPLPSGYRFGWQGNSGFTTTYTAGWCVEIYGSRETSEARLSAP